MKRKTLCESIFLILLSASFVFVPIGRTDTSDVLSAWAFKVPTIDGVIGSGEWDDAAEVTVTLVSQSSESHSATIYEKNDALYMYFAVKVLGDDFNAQDGVFFYFNNDHDGGLEQGDDWLYVLAWTGGLGHAEDGYYNASVSTLRSDEGDGGTNDIVGAASHTNIGGIGDYAFELGHPLDSADDAHDFSLKPGDTAGFKMEFDDRVPGGSQSSPWPGFGQFADVRVARAEFRFNAVWDSFNYPVFISSDSTVANFIFNQSLMQTSFEVSGETGTKGYCNVTIPETLLKGEPWIVKVNGVDWNFAPSGNATHSFVYFNYTHASTFQVVIQGTWVVPEFPSAIILPIFIITTLVATIMMKKARKPK